MRRKSLLCRCFLLACLIANLGPSLFAQTATTGALAGTVTDAANNLATGNFGQITSTSVNPRLVQLALKYIF